MSQQTYFDTHSINHILYPKMFNVRVLPNTHADIKSIALEKKKNSFEIYICCARNENQGIYRNRHAQI